MVVQENMMTASNLSICVGPSLIWTLDQSYMMEQNYSKEVSSLVQILIEQYRELYDTNTPELFCQGEPVRAGAGALESAGAPAERTSSLTSNKSDKSQKSKQSKGEQHSRDNVHCDHIWSLLSTSHQQLQIGHFIIFN